MLESGCLFLLLACAFTKWFVIHKVDALTMDIDRSRKTFRQAREDLRIANSRRGTVRQELAQTRKQVAIRMQDIEILSRQIELEESEREAELIEFQKLKDAASSKKEVFATRESRAIFG